MPAGWNYAARQYRPQKSILEGTWKFPEAPQLMLGVIKFQEHNTKFSQRPLSAESCPLEGLWKCLLWAISGHFSYVLICMLD
jgi:hypothetical protein